MARTVHPIEKSDYQKPRMKRENREKFRFKPEYIEQSYRIVSEFGASKAQVCEVLGCHIEDFRKWEIRYPALKQAYQNGLDEYTSKTVERSLFKRALGYDYEATEIKKDQFGDVKEEKVKSVHVPPDVRAAESWLYCRNRERWRGLREHLAKIDKNVLEEKRIDIKGLEQLSVEELEAVDRILAKTMSEEVNSADGEEKTLN
ncbi:MAG: hypothetical protein ACTSYH_03395 [Candidatus Heimdallarchaeaceae archaeon]